MKHVGNGRKAAHIMEMCLTQLITLKVCRGGDGRGETSMIKMKHDKILKPPL